MIDIDEKLNVSELLRVYGALLTPHQAEIMRQYYDCDISLFEIASDLDVSRQAVRDVLVRSVKTLKDVDKKTSPYRKVFLHFGCDKRGKGRREEGKRRRCD